MIPEPGLPFIVTFPEIVLRRLFFVVVWARTHKGGRAQQSANMTANAYRVAGPIRLSRVQGGRIITQWILFGVAASVKLHGSGPWHPILSFLTGRASRHFHKSLGSDRVQSRDIQPTTESVFFRLE